MKSASLSGSRKSVMRFSVRNRDQRDRQRLYARFVPPPKRDKDAAMRTAALFLALMLAACSRPGFHMTDISGAMPRLNLHMTRASDGAEVNSESFRGKVVVLYF